MARKKASPPPMFFVMCEYRPGSAEVFFTLGQAKKRAVYMLNNGYSGVTIGEIIATYKPTVTPIEWTKVEAVA